MILSLDVEAGPHYEPIAVLSNGTRTLPEDVVLYNDVLTNVMLVQSIYGGASALLFMADLANRLIDAGWVVAAASPDAWLRFEQRDPYQKAVPVLTISRGVLVGVDAILAHINAQYDLRAGQELLAIARATGVPRAYPPYAMPRVNVPSEVAT